MGRTFIRQDTQIRRSDVYDDSIAPTEAAYETNPVNIEEDLNSLRSQLQNILNRNGASMPSGNWYDNIVAPSTFESGAQRGVSEINQQLHDLERKRVLVENHILTDIVVPASEYAQGSLDADAGNFVASETVTTGTKTYTFTSPLGANDGDVLLGATASDSLDNLIAAINLAAGGGTLYAAATTANGFVSAVSGTPSVMDVTALVAGTSGNTIATTDTSTNVSWVSPTLDGGAGDSVVLALGELPTITVAAVGAVTTLGTVAAYNSVFPNQSLAEVGGTTAISPKNLSIIVDADTRDPILSGGRVVYALFQTETVTDGHTMTGTTPVRAMLSFVRINSAGDDLEFVPASDIAGKDINYTTKTRKAMEDLTEQDFLKGAEIDVPSAATVTRQVAYDNQGTTAVDLTTNATLDLEGAGLIWAIRDDLEANLFRVIEGSAGGTSTVEVSAGIDVFDVNAVVNDFNAGVTIRSGGTRPIAVGVTDGVIESTSGDLRVNATGEFFLDDGNQTGSTWAQTDGIKLSETTAEWDAYEVKFGGEVSLLNAIVQAANQGARKTKIYANLTANVAANNDVGGTGGGANLDAQLPDMSGGTFITDYDVFLNGNLLRPGVDAAANNDYYPGTSLAIGQLMFEFNLKGTGATPDVLCVVPYNP